MNLKSVASAYYRIGAVSAGDTHKGKKKIDVADV